MSVGIAEESVCVHPLTQSVESAVIFSPGPRAIVTISPADVHDTDVLFEKIAQSHAVLVECLDGSSPIAVERPEGRESDTQWLTRAVTVVVSQVVDDQVAFNLVAATFARCVGAPVRIELRPVQSEDSTAAGPRLQRDPWYARSRPIPLMQSAGGDWVLLDSSGSLDPNGDARDLVEALATRLLEAEARTVRHQSALRSQLARAVSHGDAQGFVDSAAELVEGPVCLKDSTGLMIAASANSVEKDCTNETPLRDDFGLRGTLLVNAVRPAVIGHADLDLTDLALALLKVRDATNRCYILENQLAVMSYFVERDVDPSRPEPVEHSYRLVTIRSALDTYRSRDRLVTRLLEAASTMPLLSGLSLVARPDAILGAYSDDGSAPELHQVSWEILLHAVDPTDSLRIVVSDTVTSSKRNNRQHAAIEQVSHLQRDESGYFSLPPVVVFDHLGPLAGVLHAVPGQQIVPYVRRVLGDLITDDRFGGQLIETLYAYLQSGGSPRRAGTLLHLHGSSVKYRMRVVRELLGDRLDDPNKRFDLELALRLYLAGRSLNAKLAS